MTQLTSPSGGSGAVSSVAGRTGDVVLTGADIGAGAFPALRLASQTISGTATLVTGTQALILADTTSAAFTITLPAAPTAGDLFIFEDSAAQWATHNLTIGLNGKNLNGSSSNPVLVTGNAAFGILYDGTGWHSIIHAPSDANPAMDGTAAPGTGFAYSRRDHVHPTDTSRAPSSGIAPSAITGTAVVTADSRLSDARTPTAHKTTHATGGSDAMTAADIGATTAAAALTAAKAVSLDQFAAPAGDVAWGSHKITGLTNGSGAQDAAAFGQIPIAGTVGGASKVVRRSGNSGNVNSSGTGTTLTNDDTLLWAVGASDVWFFQAFLLISAANTAMDFKCGWSVPTGGVMTWGANGSGQPGAVASYTNLAATSTPVAMLTASGSLAHGTAALTTGLGLAGVYVGDGSHTGNVTLQWAQNTSDAGNLALLANSLIIAWRIA